MIILGIVVFYSLLYVVTYVSMYWEYLEKLFDCIVLLLTIAVCWVLCWIDSIKKRKMIGNGAKKHRIKLRIFILVLLILASGVSMLYTYNRGEAEWFNELVTE